MKAWVWSSAPHELGEVTHNAYKEVEAGGPGVRGHLQQVQGQLGCSPPSLSNKQTKQKESIHRVHGNVPCTQGLSAVAKVACHTWKQEPGHCDCGVTVDEHPVETKRSPEKGISWTTGPRATCELEGASDGFSDLHKGRLCQSLLELSISGRFFQITIS